MQYKAIYPEHFVHSYISNWQEEAQGCRTAHESNCTYHAKI